jgi:hypothetical protein
MERVCASSRKIDTTPWNAVIIFHQQSGMAVLLRGMRRYYRVILVGDKKWPK